MERSAATFINHAVFWVMLAKNDDIDHDDGLLARVTAACIAADNALTLCCKQCGVSAMQSSSSLHMISYQRLYLHPPDLSYNTPLLPADSAHLFVACL